MQRKTLSALVILAIVSAAAASYLLPFDSQSPEQEALRARAIGAMSGMEILQDPRPVPATEIEDATGEPMKLADLAGRVSLVNFWATWCAPCIEEMPTLSRLQDRIGGEDFQVVIVSIDREGYKAIRPFLKDLGISNLESLLDRSNRLTIEVGAIGLPTTLLLNQNAQIVGRMIGPAEWDSDEAVRLIETLID